MRTTVTIDDDVLSAVHERARREKRSAGAVLSELARSALVGPGLGLNGEPVLGFRPLPSRGGLVTDELVHRIREADGL